MEELRTYLNSLNTAEQKSYAKRCGTTIGYLRKALSTQPRLDAVLCAKLDKESLGAVRKESLRRDVDFSIFSSVDRMAA